MNLSDLRVGVQPGDGLVTNLGTAAVVVPAPLPDDQAFYDEVIATVESVATGSGPDVGPILIRKLADLITRTAPERTVAFGLLADTGDAIAVMLCGAVDMQLSADGGRTESLSGRDATMWLDRIIRGDADLITILPSGTTAAGVHPRSDLRHGTVCGSGLALSPRTAPAVLAPPAAPAAEDRAPVGAVAPVVAVAPVAAVAPVPPGPPVPEVASGADVAPVDDLVSPDEPAPFVSVAGPAVASVTLPPAPAPEQAVSIVPMPSAESDNVPPPPGARVVSAPPDPPEPIATAEAAAPVEQDPDPDPHTRDQFVSIMLSGPLPDRAALPMGGAAEDAATAPPVGGPAQSARLIDRNRTPIPLDRDLVLGREPQISQAVTAGQATPITITDPTLAVSRVHAGVSFVDGAAVVTDLGSANGTRIAQPGDADWTALAAHESRRVRPGGKILIGGEELTFVVDSPPAGASPDPAATDPDERRDSLPPVEVIAAARPASGSEGVADYVFVRPLGHGPVNTQFLARPPERLHVDAEFVVVKVFGGATSDDAFRRAARELRACAAAESPYLIKVHDAGQDAGRLFYSMDYITGGSLAEPVRTPTHDEIVRAVAQAARAAHALHEVGVVHQGITPKNVLLGAEHAYLANLGLAQLIAPGQDVTSLGTFGELEYLEPAILTGGRGSRSSDIWSLGATLHRALTGVGIYEDLSEQPLLAIRKVLTEKPVISPDLPQDEADIVRACLQEDPAARPITALVLAEHLEGLIVEPSVPAGTTASGS